MLNYLLKHTCKFTGIILSLFCLSRVLIADVLLHKSDPRGMNISYHPAIPCIDSLYINEKIYSIFNYDNHSYRNPIGTPLIPTETIYFAAPYGDMMLTGCFGLVRAFASRIEKWRREVERTLEACTYC